MVTLKEKLKYDAAIPAQSIASGTVTSAYYDTSGYDSSLFILNTGPIADTKKAILQIMENDVAGATGAAELTGYTSTVEAVVKATAMKVYVNTPDNDDAVTINGLTFTKKAAKDDTKREFTTVAELVAQINLWIPGCTASVTDTSYASLISTNPGALAFTAETTDSTKLAVSLEEGIASVEVPEGAGERWLAAKVTTDATIVCSVTLIRGNARKLPVTQAA